MSIFSRIYLMIERLNWCLYLFDTWIIFFFSYKTRNRSQARATKFILFSLLPRSCYFSSLSLIYRFYWKLKLKLGCTYAVQVSIIVFIFCLFLFLFFNFPLLMNYYCQKSISWSIYLIKYCLTFNKLLKVLDITKNNNNNNNNYYKVN